MNRPSFDADLPGSGRTRRPVLALLAGLFLLAGPAGAVQAETLRVAVEGEYPPFSVTDAKGRLSGFDVDIAKALCAAMQADCKTVKQQWDRMIPDLAAGKYDMIVSSMSITETRRQKVDFTEAYYHTPAKFVRKKGSGVEITPAGLKGRKIGVQRATTHDSYLTSAHGGTATIVRYDTLGQAEADLAAGKIDALFADAMALSDGFLKTAKGKGFEFVGPDVRDRRWFGEGIGIAVRKGDTDLRAKLNQALATIRADGTYAKIEQSYFPFRLNGVAAAGP